MREESSHFEPGDDRIISEKVMIVKAIMVLAVW